MKTKSFAARASFSLLLYVLLANVASATNYTLTLTAQGSGVIYRNPTNTSYPSGVTVTITGTPNAGWYFANWSGDVNSTVNPLNVMISSNINITGTFLQYPTYNLALATNGQGGIALSPSGGSYLSNTMVQATATAANGWVFAGWSGATTGSANPVSFAVDSSGMLTGTFAQLPAFDVQPISVTNKAGSDVSFSAAATGTGTLSYQWYFDGSLLSGATGTTLSLTSVGTGNVGNYWVVVTNNYGSATSLVASLTLTNGGGPTNAVTSPTEASLRAAIALGGWVGIGFNGTLTLTNTIAITNNVVLDGTGFGAVISGGNAVQLFNVANGASLTLTNLTLANGSCVVTNGPAGTPADGGAVKLVNCTLTNNSAQSLTVGGLARGGAIFNNGGNVLLIQSGVSNNAAIGGGSYNLLSSTYEIGTGLGGAIYNTNGSVTMSGCNISSNVCEGVGAPTMAGGSGLSMGGAAYQASGTLTIANSTFATNLALGCVGAGPGEFAAAPAGPAYGGALAAAGGNVTINFSQFTANSATGGNSGFDGSGASGFGGAIYSTATLNVTDSSLFANRASAGGSVDYHYVGSIDGFGGGIYNSGTAVFNRCLICSNNVQGGLLGAYSFETTTGFRGLGGGIFNASQFAATNCTVALNLAIGGAGDPGTSGNAIGGGVFNSASAIFTAMNLTIASNSCSSPAGVQITSGFTAGYQIANTNGTLSVHNTLIAYSGTNSGAYGPITDVGYNICSDGSASLFSGSSYNYTDPQLAPLGNYGGPTPCMALLSTSPAIDNGDIHGCPNTDQRGYIRPIGSGPDMGAYEYGSVPLVVPHLSINLSGSNAVLSFAVLPPSSYYLQCSTDLATWINLSTNGPITVSTNVSQTISKQGTDHCYFRLLMQ